MQPMMLESSVTQSFAAVRQLFSHQVNTYLVTALIQQRAFLSLHIKRLLQLFHKIVNLIESYLAVRLAYRQSSR